MEFYIEGDTRGRLASGSSSGSLTYDIVGEQGPPGPKGDPGESLTVTGSTLLPSGDTELAFSDGTTSVIQQGPRGPEGPEGPEGPTGVVSATDPLSYDSGSQSVSLDTSGFQTLDAQGFPAVVSLGHQIDSPQELMNRSGLTAATRRGEIALWAGSEAQIQEGMTIGGGRFVAVPGDSSTTADGVTTIRDASGMLWERPDLAEVKASWAGALGIPGTRHLSDFFGSVSAAQAAYGNSVVPDGADLSAITIDWAAIQRAIDLGMNLDLPTTIHSGDFHLSDTLLVGKMSGYTTAHLKGGGPTYRGEHFTHLHADSFLDRPAIAVQGARKTRIEDLAIMGGNESSFTEANYSADVSDYITSGASSGQHNPYCGVAIDPYSGNEPAQPYPNGGGYGGNYSVGVHMSGLHIQHFVAGIAVQPCDHDGNGEDILLEKSAVGGCAYGWSQGNAQGNHNAIRDSYLGQHHTVYTTRTHGRQHGDMPRLDNVLSDHSYRMFDVQANWGDSKVYTDVFGELIGTLGRFVGSSNAGSHTFIGCNIDFEGDYSEGKTLEGVQAPLEFIGCTLGLPKGSGHTVFNSKGADLDWRQGNQIRFSGCTIGGTSHVAFSHADGFVVENSKVADSADHYINTRGPVNLWPRTDIAHTVQEVELIEVEGSYAPGEYWVRSRPAMWQDSSSTGTFSWTGTTVTFSTSSPEAYQTGDLLAWADDELGLEVVSADSGAGTVTAEAQFDSIDSSNPPEGGVKLYMPRTLIRAIVTCDTTSGSATLTNVSDTSGFAVGDFVNEEFLPVSVSYARITAIDAGSSTIDLNVSCDSSEAGVRLACSYLEAKDKVAGTSTDSASAVSASYNQAEVQAILDELRDVKQKLRESGQMEA